MPPPQSGRRQMGVHPGEAFRGSLTQSSAATSSAARLLQNLYDVQLVSSCSLYRIPVCPSTSTEKPASLSMRFARGSENRSYIPLTSHNVVDDIWDYLVDHRLAPACTIRSDIVSCPKCGSRERRSRACSASVLARFLRVWTLRGTLFPGTIPAAETGLSSVAIINISPSSTSTSVISDISEWSRVIRQRKPDLEYETS